MHVRPLGLIAGPEAAEALAAGRALPLAGGPVAFCRFQIFADGRWRTPVRVNGHDGLKSAEAEAALERLRRPRPPLPLAGGGSLAMDRSRPLVMGVVNVTPDSFSGDGRPNDPQAAIEAGLAMVRAGADVVDVGGESTRPGAQTVSVQQEIDRILPVVEGLAADAVTVSIDTRHAKVMAAACRAGAAIINDVTALQGDPAALEAAARSGAAVVLMHMLGEPATMQENPVYQDVLRDVFDYLESRVEACLGAGIAAPRIMVDPGIGFGKTLDHNLTLIRNLAMFHGLGCAVLLGASRKSFIGRLSGEQRASGRMPGSIAAALAGAAQGAHMVRVHDVAETVQALGVWAGLSAQAGFVTEP